MTAHTIPTLPGDVSDTSRTPAINSVRFAAIPTRRKPRPHWLRTSAAAFAVTALLGALEARAAHLTTGAELVQAIATSPGQVVILDHSTKISSPSSPGTQHTVPTGATIILRPGVSFEIVEVG